MEIHEIKQRSVVVKSKDIEISLFSDYSGDKLDSLVNHAKLLLNHHISIRKETPKKKVEYLG